MNKYKRYMIISFLFIITLLIVYFFLIDSSYNYTNNGKLIINELMANNLLTIKDDDNEYSDWIELYNGYNTDINLKDYSLSDNEYETNKWTFPNITIKSKSYLIVYASGKDKCNNNICHTNFKLSSKGEIVVLTDSKNNLLSKVTYLESNPSTSYGYINRRYAYYYNPTPNTENTGKNSNNPIKIKNNDVTLYFNEYLTNNQRFNTDNEGDYSSWVELYNYGESDIDLANFMISDDLKEINKYILPNIIIKSKSYLVIYLSGKNKYDREIHTNFKLGDSDNNLILSDNYGQVIDSIELVSLKDNISYGKDDESWCYYTYPTPGKINNTMCFDKIS